MLGVSLLGRFHQNTKVHRLNREAISPAHLVFGKISQIFGVHQNLPKQTCGSMVIMDPHDRPGIVWDGVGHLEWCAEEYSSSTCPVEKRKQSSHNTIRSLIICQQLVEQYSQMVCGTLKSVLKWLRRDQATTFLRTG